MGKVGIRKDYQRQFEELQRDMQGVKPWVKKEYYKAFYKSIAKAADQRLIELERLSDKKGYQDVTEWAYKVAQREIKAMFGEGAKRFNRKQPENLNSMYKNINRVLKFLNAPTSSIQGIREVQNKRADTINSKYGTNLNWSDVGHLFESALWKKVNSKYGSKTALKAIGQIQKHEDNIKKALKQHKPISITIAPEKDASGKLRKDIKVEDAVNKFLRYYKTDVSKLTNKI